MKDSSKQEHFKLKTKRMRSGSSLISRVKLAGMVRTLKITAFLALFICIKANGKAFSQQISLSLKNVPLSTVFKEIQNQTNYQFLYTEEVLSSKKKVTLQVKDAALETVLQKFLAPENLEYVIDAQTIVVRKKTIPVPTFTLKDISGKIVSENGDPIAGASIVVKGTSVGTSSDANGNFKLETAQEKVTLVISFVGFETKEVVVSGNAPINITLANKSEAMEDIVVIGYGTQKKIDVTGAISTVKASEVNQGINQSVPHALQGRASGVTVLQSAGDPGAGVSMRIRGAGTLNDNNPLYVVDGIIGSIDGINPSDIENISVLKDAASAAIYGSRGANGVVIVTTKKGRREQPTTITVNSSQGIQQAWKMPTALTAEERNLIHKEALTNDQTPTTEPIWDYYNNPQNATTRTDWFREVLQNAYTTSNDVSINSGTKTSNYAFSLGYLNTDGIVRGSNFKRYNVRFNSQHEIVKNLTFGENISIVVGDRRSVATRASWDGVLSSALFNFRNIPVYENEAEQIYGAPMGDFPNPVASINSRDNFSRNASVGGNFYLEYKFLKSFTAKTDFAYNYAFNKNKGFVAVAKNGGRGLSENSLSENFTTGSTWIWNNTLNFDREFGKHRVSALAGMSAESGIVEWTSSGTAKNFSNQHPSLRYLSNATLFQGFPSGGADDYTLQGYFGRVGYSFDDKYILAANIRRDGSSKFAPNTRWGTFPSISAGWRVSEEAFFESLSNAISDFKIRGSWGKLGNDKIPNYQFYSTVSTVDAPTLNGEIFTAVAQNKMANPDIRWEVTTQTDVGFDLGLFDNKFSLAFDYFHKNTTDILVRVPLISSLGVGESPFRNAGNVTNKGYEAQLAYRNQHNKLRYEVTANFSQVKNKLESFGIEGASDIYISDYKNINVGRFAEGTPLGHFYVLNKLGIFQTQAEIDSHVDKDGNLIQPNAVPGDFKFEDVNGDGTINANDRINAGNSFPTFTYAFGGLLNYGAFDFNMLWVGTRGNKIFNGITLGGKLMQGTGYNNGKGILDRWTPDNTNTDIPRVSVRDLNNNRAYSTFFIEDGSYLRLKYLTVGYTFGKNLAGNNIIKFRLFATAQNLLTFTKYSGFDPEVGADLDYSGNMYGVDRGVYPQARTYILGINFNL